MNILMLSEPIYPRHPGGAGKSTHVLAASLTALGHRVWILCPCKESTEKELIDGVEVHRFNFEREKLPRSIEQETFSARILAYAEEHLPLDDIEVLYDSGGFLSYFYQVAYRLKHRYKFAFVVHYRYLLAQHYFGADRGSDPWNRTRMHWDSGIHESSQGFPCRFADAVICPSQRDAHFVASAFLPDDQAFVLPEPVEPVGVDPAVVDALRSELVRPEDKLAVFAGRIDDELKGPDIVKRAFKELVRRRDVRLLLLVKDDSWGRMFRVLGDAVIRRPWIVDRQLLLTTLAAADVLLMPSKYESFGLICAEALSAGTPVIASPVGGVPEMITPGLNGFLLGEGTPKRWPHELATYICQVVDDRERLVGMRAHAKASAASFAAERVAAACAEICRTAIERCQKRDRTTLSPPPVSLENRTRYLRLLERLVGAESRSVGEAVLDAWSSTAPQRCLSCTRSRLARDALSLGTLKPGRPRRIFSKIRGTWEDVLNEAVHEACPLGLLQRTYHKWP